MKLYFEYISENVKVFKRFQMQVLFGTIALTAFFIAYLYGKNPDLYIKYEGVIEQFEVGKIKVKPGGIKDLREWKFEEAIKIRINQRQFAFMGDQFEDKKETLLKNLKVGDFITITYRKIDWNDRIYEIEKNGISLIERVKYNKKWSFIAYLLPTLAIVFITLYIWVYRMRKRYIQ